MHDFREAQPVKEASVFFARNIAHNWPDAYFTGILKQLRDAATPSTRLVISDRIIPYATQLPNSPLLENYGRASSTAFGLDIGVMSAMNGLERTHGEMEEVARKAGWKLESLTKVPGDVCSANIVFSPI